MEVEERCILVIRYEEHVNAKDLLEEYALEEVEEEMPRLEEQGKYKAVMVAVRAKTGKKTNILLQRIDKREYIEQMSSEERRNRARKGLMELMEALAAREMGGPTARGELELWFVHKSDALTAIAVENQEVPPWKDARDIAPGMERETKAWLIQEGGITFRYQVQERTKA